jgi:hypothetical protein
MLRFKAIGIDPDLGRLHDFTCPAYHPADVAKYHPFTEIAELIDEREWMRKALAAACGPPDEAKAMALMMSSLSVLKAADPGLLNDFRLAAYKAFRDANPGPGTYPTPGSMSPAKYCRPPVTDGHAALSPAYDGPNTSPSVATTAPEAHSFDRPPLSAGHQSPSPSHMKGSGGEYPASQGVPVQLTYAHMEKDQARMALVRAHDQLSRQFPEVCPLDTPDSRPLRAQQPENHPVPAIAGIGKGEGAEAVLTSHAPALGAHLADVTLTATESPGTHARPVTVWKGMKKQRRKLARRVLEGSMTVDEARSKLGRSFAQKGGSEEQGAVQKSALAAVREQLDLPPRAATQPVMPSVQGPVPISMAPELIAAAQKPAAPAAAAAPVAASFGPEDIEAAVTKAVAPLLEKIREQDETYTAKLAEQQRVIDAIADQPDPSTAAFSGLAFRNPVHKQARPAAVPDTAEYAARAQDMIRRNLQHTYYTHSSPAVREAAGHELAKLGWEQPMT